MFFAPCLIHHPLKQGQVTESFERAVQIQCQQW